jgi:hypothetical protein
MTVQISEWLESSFFILIFVNLINTGSGHENIAFSVPDLNCAANLFLSSARYITLAEYEGYGKLLTRSM